MIQRILQLPDETLRSYDLSSLRITALSGSALPGDLALEWMDRFGDSIYNLYGSTEVAMATVATPEDLRAAPGTAGRPPRGTVVKLFDEDGREVPRGEVGRIFVGNEMSFEGYTGGGGKEVIDGLLSSGDVGHFDSDGRLFIDGRDDEMIVSGGENVFPREVEDLLADHESVVEVAVIGVEDEEFGQRLKAFVVLLEHAEVSAEDLKHTSRPTSPHSRRRASSSSLTSCRATRPARSSSANCTSASPRSRASGALALRRRLQQHRSALDPGPDKGGPEAVGTIEQ